ncbi:MAG: hypothetical protein K2N05_06015, partial [Muribaculaceae bacterium]|nr:hypothetical protein [Muribaculaceae bacterium]
VYMKIKIILGILISILFCNVAIAQQSVKESQKVESAYKIYGLKVPAKEFTQWEVNVEEVANSDEYDFSKYNEFERAMEDGVVDEMSNSSFTIHFSNDGEYVMDDIYDEYSGSRSFKKVESPDFIDNFITDNIWSVDVEFKDGYPHKYIGDLESFYKAIEDGETMGDACDYILLKADITYNDKYLPIKVVADCHASVGDEEFIDEITYSDYKFDSKGNWIRRTINNSIFQFREYKYKNYNSASELTPRGNKTYPPLKALDFTVTEEETDESYNPNNKSIIGINPDFMKKLGFIQGQEGRLIREDVIVWGTTINESPEFYFDFGVYLKFATEDAAKAFMKTFDALGWDKEEDNCRAENTDWLDEYSGTTISIVTRDKSTVTINQMFVRNMGDFETE